MVFLLFRYANFIHEYPKLKDASPKDAIKSEGDSITKE